MARSNWRNENLSFTMLNTWLTCREKFRFKYVERLKEKDGIWFPQGTSIHNTLYDFHQTPDADLDMLMDLAHGYYDKEIEGKEFYDYQGNRLSKEDIDAARDDTIRWLNGYIAAVKAGDFPFVEFARPPEQDIEAPIEGSRLVARGMVDFFCERVTVLPTGEVLMKSDDGSVHLGDFKTGSKKFNAWNQTKADIDLQPTVYGYIMGRPLTFHYIIIEKTASHEKPSLKHIVTMRDDQDYAMYERIVAAFETETDRLNDYKNGKFYPEPHMGFGKFCDKLCGYKDQCWAVNYDRTHRIVEEEPEQVEAE